MPSTNSRRSCHVSNHDVVERIAELVVERLPSGNEDPNVYSATVAQAMKDVPRHNCEPKELYQLVITHIIGMNNDFNSRQRKVRDPKRLFVMKVAKGHQQVEAVSQNRILHLVQ
jgi:hypothetical protein